MGKRYEKILSFFILLVEEKLKPRFFLALGIAREILLKKD